jgi:hypothetical protein
MYIDPLVLDNKAMERDPFVHDLPITVHMANFYGHVRLLAGMSCVDGMGKPVDRTKVLWLLFVVLWCQRVPQGSPKIIKGRQCDDPLEYPFVLNRLLHISKMDNYSTRTHTYIYTYIHIHTHTYIFMHTQLCVYIIYICTNPCLATSWINGPFKGRLRGAVQPLLQKGPGRTGRLPLGEKCPGLSQIVGCFFLTNVGNTMP